MLKVRDLRKTYVSDQGPVEAVCGVSFEVQKGEIFTLLGPSGCGKSTTLRCIAGIETPNEGEIELGDRVVFSSPKRVNVQINERGTGMVFQSYAIWPHMSVFDNVVFPLRHGPNKAPKKDWRPRAMQALERVQMASMADRPAPLLSGGQQQRVALARALVYEPTVLLLDEPLSNLDAKLRVSMRTELQGLIKDLKVTTLYVTHDQEEALVISDLIAVMQNGMIQQLEAPRGIYMNPTNAYVAGFIGQTNFITGTIEKDQPKGKLVVACSFGKVECTAPGLSDSFSSGDKVLVTIRPEEIISYSDAPQEQPNTFTATVLRTIFIGNRTQCELQIGSERCQTEVEGRSSLNTGAKISAQLPPDRIRILPSDTT